MTKVQLIATAIALLPLQLYGQRLGENFEIEFGTREHRRCSFVASPINYCDARFSSAYKKALETRLSDFNREFIVVAVDSRPEYGQQSIVAVNSKTKMVYPLPFDFLAASFPKSPPYRNGRLTYSQDSNELCVDGAILAYRSVQSGQMCWRLEGNQFVGEITPYTYPDH